MRILQRRVRFRRSYGFICQPRLLALVFTGAFLLLTSCGSPVALSTDRPRMLPTLHLNLDDRITALDFLVQEDRWIHALWTLVSKDRDGRRTFSVWYRHGDLTQWSWDEPIRLGEALERPRLLAHESTLHAIYGRELRHSISKDGGRTWREAPSLLEGSGRRTQRFDAVIQGDRIVVVYLAHPDYFGSAREQFDVWSMIVSGEGVHGVSRIDSVRGKFSALHPDPSLTSSAGVIRLAYLFNDDNADSQSSASVTRRLFYRSSFDSGATWSGAKGMRSTTIDPGPVTGLEISEHWGKTFLAFSTSALYLSSIQEFESASHILSRYCQAAPAVVATHDSLRVFWIDTRHRLPVEGIPWSDASYANNDVMSTSLGNSGGPNRLPERQWTPDFSYAECIRTFASGGRAYVMWSGREKVGRRLDSEGHPAELFFIALGK